MNSNIPKPYIKAIDSLRIISILAVILIHTTTRTLEASHFNLNSFNFTLLLNQVSRFAVPLFFAISGFVLEMNYTNHQNFLSYLKKRVSRIFIPYLFWSTLYYFFIYKVHSVNFLQAILTGDASYQLYFIPSLLIFYLLFPLIHKIYKFISNKWIVIVLGVIQFGLLYQDYFGQSLSIPYPISVALFNFYIFILGMIALHHKEWLIQNIKKIKYILLPTVIFLAGYIFQEGKSLYLKSYDIGYFYSQWRPSVLIYTTLLSPLLFYILDKSRFQFGIIEKISKLSFLVFFIHVIILEVFWGAYGKLIFDKPLFDVLFFLTVSGVSFGVAYLAHKIPNLSKITG